MARPLAKICDINDNKELWKVSIRVHHKWKVVSNGREHFEMIFVDVSGGDIHIVVPAPHISLFDEKMALYHSYTVSNFKVQPNVAAFRPSSHKFLLKFTTGTTVTNVNKNEIPAKPLVFTKFTDIITGNFNKDVLIDIIGMVESIGYSLTISSARKQQINMMLRDNGDNTINCTLWESYAEQFLKFNQERGDDSGPMFVMLQYAKVKEQGKFPLSVTNTFNVTLLGLNIDLPPMKQVMESMPKESMITLSGQITFCVIVDETKMLVVSPYGWYKIEIQVTHAGNSCNFLFWDRECELLLGLSASQLRHTMIKAGIHDPLEFPLALDQMLDRKMAFKIKWQPQWKNASVVMLLKNDPFVKELSDQLDTAEESVDEVKGIALSEPDFVVDALSNSEDDYSSSNTSDSDDDIEQQPLSDSNIQEYSDIGDQIWECTYCHAHMWLHERSRKTKKGHVPTFHRCCQGGKIVLPLLEEPPPLLQHLLYNKTSSDSKNYRNNIRTYNSMFSFTSPGMKFDTKYSKTGGPPTLKLHGQTCHRIGTLLPETGQHP
ncbi:uncharacterized protein LOC131662571 [Vicia villosa]|uniref:uncharacterized protein LOC131662571 n=1 Tax=Vicia villosa TaxID=3911 RepID=UPI00273BE0CE|nr:uncharacterized protein LOC131662571 [Vicia villosa]